MYKICTCIYFDTKKHCADKDSTIYYMPPSYSCCAEHSVVVKCTIIFHMHTIYFCHNFDRKTIILNRQYDKLVKINLAALLRYVYIGILFLIRVLKIMLMLRIVKLLNSLFLLLLWNLLRTIAVIPLLISPLRKHF